MSPRLDTEQVRARLVAGGDAQLLLDEVEPGDKLGHRVLDLQPGVHLEEHVLLRPGVDEALHGARVAVADRLGGTDGPGEHLPAQLRRHARRRRLLGDLLVPPLH